MSAATMGLLMAVALGPSAKSRVVATIGQRNSMQRTAPLQIDGRVASVNERVIAK